MIQSTGQPDFLSPENRAKYMNKEKERDNKRREEYMKVKIDTMDPKGMIKQEALMGAAGKDNY